MNTRTFDWSDKVIMIVEDEFINYLYLEQILEPTHAEIIWKPNGVEALEYFRLNKQPNVILLDLQLPVIDGFKVLEEIRKVSAGVPVIVQTAYAMESQKQKCYDLGCNEYLVKPYIEQDILESIENQFKVTLEN